jgi:hypothetical protein
VGERQVIEEAVAKAGHADPEPGGSEDGGGDFQDGYDVLGAVLLQ